MCKETTDIPVEEKQEEAVRTVIVDYKTVLKVGGTVIFGILCYKYGRKVEVKRCKAIARKNYRRGYCDGVADVLLDIYLNANKKGETK